MKVLCCYDDLLKENHILIAGATGSGKSVVVNCLVYTAIAHGPDRCRLILLDKKKVELIDYKYLPHTLQYADEDDTMIQALQFAVNEIDRRYAEMQRQRVKMYQGPDVYVVIDELADLMTIPTVKKHAQPLIQRIGQIGRAARYHLILSTQCPLSSVLSTQIKCNCDVRIGLRTACAQDSRNIISAAGCERLPDPRVAGFARGYVRKGADLTLVNLPMYPENMVREGLAQFRRPTFSRPAYNIPKKKTNWFAEMLSGIL